MSFEEWWEIEKLKLPYTNPKAIAKSAWDFMHEVNLGEYDRGWCDGFEEGKNV